MPAQDLPAIIRQLAETPGSAMRRQLLGEHAEWGAHEENTARLLEIVAYQLDLEWSRITTDPDDPAVRRERLKAKRRNLKPPPRPLVPPVALRPDGLAEQRLNEYLEQIAEHATPKRVKTMVSRAEFDKAMGLD